MRIAALILAAGRSTRMGGENKLLADLNGRPLICATLANAIASRARPVVVVTGHASSDICAALAGAAVTFAHNPDYAAGMATSLRTGLSLLSSAADGAVILLGDMPLIAPAVIDRLIDAATAQPDAAAIVPTVEGEWAHPVLLRRTLFDDVMRLTGDAGARRLLAERPDVATVAIDDPRCLMDADDRSGLDTIRKAARG